MENLYNFHFSSSYSEQPSMAPPPSQPPPALNAISSIRTFVQSSSSSSDDSIKALQTKVASHPLFPQLLQAHIDCHKVGAPPEMAQVFDGMRGENSGVCHISGFSGADPDLDLFMEMYCDLLVKYKWDLSRPYDEATAFLNHMETQLHSICHPAATNNTPQTDEVGGSSEKDFSTVEKEATVEGRRNEVQEFKDGLLHRYSGYITNLKHEFSKKKKKEKLPKQAKQILLAWWNVHFKWPYPTDADKVALAEWTGLDQKQVNNWFVNQRKRHWKSTEEMQAIILNGLYGPPHQ
ncbi:homeobox protein knotted-1-like 6 [Abrus precatorius]|uniref:Homeobox protein knotted-1-like 6 n=1 Tax=Abrus precatorius TaxID=3816 RepID=A0A8B8K133_ABRPR|nr:homeobox protein knotted-1-like 6 [Abrus precatorius]